jgi:hypothetical protein
VGAILVGYVVFTLAQVAVAGKVSGGAITFERSRSSTAADAGASDGHGP